MLKYSQLALILFLRLKSSPLFNALTLTLSLSACLCALCSTKAPFVFRASSQKKYKGEIQCVLSSMFFLGHKMSNKTANKWMKFKQIMNRVWGQSDGKCKHLILFRCFFLSFFIFLFNLSIFYNCNAFNANVTFHQVCRISMLSAQ